MSRDEVVESQRRRLFDAMAHLCSERGYLGFSVADIVKRARVSRATFYELFRNKEECFLGAIEFQLRRVLNAVTPAFQAHHEWPDRMEASIEALLEFTVSEPEYARMSMLESQAAGDAAYERYSAGWRLFIAMIEGGRTLAPPGLIIPPTAARAVLGAGEQLMVSEMIAGRTHRLRELLPDILFFVLAPYLGVEEALRRSERSRRPHAV